MKSQHVLEHVTLHDMVGLWKQGILLTRFDSSRVQAMSTSCYKVVYMYHMKKTTRWSNVCWSAIE